MIARRGAPSAVLGAALLLLSATPSRAEPTPAEKKAAAQTLFDDARKLTADGKFAEACPKFVESVALDATMGTKFYLADCFEHIGKIASAWAYYVEVTDAARAVGMKDREAYAREHAEALLPKLSRLTIQVSAEARGAAGLSVTRDGLVINQAIWGTAVPVDPGDHVVSASAEGKAPWTERVEVKDPGQTVTIEVPALRDQPKDKSSPPPPPPPPPPIKVVPPPRSGSTQRIAGVVVGVLGLGGIALGAGFGVRAIGKNSDSNEGGHCDAQSFCDSTGLTLRKESITAATISTVGFVAGGALLAGGVALLLTAPRAAPKKAPSAGLVVGPAGLSMIGRW